jgi:hypothetical protein
MGFVILRVDEGRELTRLEFETLFARLLEVQQESLPTCVVGRLEAVAELKSRSERPLAAAASPAPPVPLLFSKKNDLGCRR